jgi:hypothetical protein
MLRALLILLAAAVLMAGPNALNAASDPPLELTWAKLIPPATGARPMKSFLAGRDASATSVPSHSSSPEGKWMSSPSQSAGEPPALVTELDGKRVHIGGYVVPLDFESTTVKEFLLVPFVGACIHVPPPPANQIIYVKADQGFQVKGEFDPVYVTGVLKASVTFTGLAETGYSITAEKVETRG